MEAKRSCCSGASVRPQSSVTTSDGLGSALWNPSQHRTLLQSQYSALPLMRTLSPPPPFAETSICGCVALAISRVFGSPFERRWHHPSLPACSTALPAVRPSYTSSLSKLYNTTWIENSQWIQRKAYKCYYSECLIFTTVLGTIFPSFISTFIIRLLLHLLHCEWLNAC